MSDGISRTDAFFGLYSFLSSLHLSARQREDVCRQSLPESSGLRVDVELTARGKSRLI